MRSAARLWLVVAPAAALAGGGALALAVTSDHETASTAFLVLALLVGWAFIAAGLVARTRRPANRTGLLLIGVGFAWFLNGLAYADNSYVWTLGYAAGSLWAAVFVHALLAYPSGVLAARRERIVVAGGYALAAVANIAIGLFEPDPARCSDCPTNQLLIAHNHTAATALLTAVQVLGAVYLLSVGVAVVLRWRRSSDAARRLLGPVLLAGGASLGLHGAALALAAASTTVSGLLSALAALALLAVPFLLLSGLLRTRLARADVGKLLVETSHEATPHEAQENLRRSLHDSTLDLTFWLPERGVYVDIDGQPYELPFEDPARAVTPIAYGDHPIGALVHDPSLLDEPELIETFVAAARLAIERDHLQAELLARVDELERERNFIRDVVNAAPSYFLVADEDGCIVRFNDTLHTATAIADDDAVRGRPWWEVFTLPPDADGVRDWFLAARHADGSTVYEARTAGNAGELVTAWTVTPVTDEGNLQRYLLTGLDLTVRVRQQQALETSERRSRALLEGVPDNIYRVAREGHRFLDIRWADPTRLPVPQERFIGATVRDLGLPTELAERFIAAAETAFRTGRVQSLDYAVDQPGGEPLYLEARVVPSGDDEYFVTIRDVSDRKRAEIELRQSRARLVEAGDAERRRLERNLHDGAQQRLVSLSLSLRLAQARLARDPAAAGDLLAGASEELALALEDLRELARGIHPAVLTDRGLGPALESLADRTPVPVELAEVPAERLPRPVEAAAFYVVAEALTNVAKYADASSVRVSVARSNGRAIVEVADDGRGGADPSRGSGLRGLVDRVAALDGLLSVDSPAGGGTRVRAEIPCTE